ncbi:MAG: hypothetical protein SO401_01860 [Blautia sp.]|nr:hypothetical protein [Blautia sp.]
MKKYTKKLISMFLSFALLFSTVSTTVFADSVPVTTGDSQAVTEDVNNDNAVSSTSTEAKPDQVTQSSDENAPKQEDTLEVSDATKDALVEDVDDPVKADDKNTEDANAQETEQAETKSPVEDVKYPAWQTEKQLDGGIKVTVKAPEGAFPEGVSVSVTKVDAKLIEQAVDKVAKEKVEAKDITAFDFKFSTSEDSNLEPKLPISVTFTKLDTEENDKLTLFHLKNQTSKAESAQTDVADAKNGKLSFTASMNTIRAACYGQHGRC